MFFGEESDFNFKLGKPEIRTIECARFGICRLGLAKQDLLGLGAES